jgi:hypothetical protein
MQRTRWSFAQTVQNTMPDSKTPVADEAAEATNKKGG